MCTGPHAYARFAWASCQGGRGFPNVRQIIVRLWRWRRLLLELAMRDFKARYAGSVLGTAWSVLEPLVQFGLYLAVFGFFLGMRLERNASMGNFGLYLISGLVPFGAFQESVLRATGLLRERAQLVRHVKVPLEVLVAASLLAIFSRHGVALVLVAAAALVFGSASLAGLPWLAGGILILVVGVFGLALAFVVAGAYLPDLSQIAATGTTVLFFLTPIVYPASLVRGAFARVLPLNPLWGTLSCFRTAFVGSPPERTSFAIAAACAVVFFWLGCTVFEARRRQLPDLA